jgi:hypothetical protein
MASSTFRAVAISFGARPSTLILLVSSARGACFSSVRVRHRSSAGRHFFTGRYLVAGDATLGFYGFHRGEGVGSITPARWLGSFWVKPLASHIRGACRAAANSSSMTGMRGITGAGRAINPETAVDRWSVFQRPHECSLFSTSRSSPSGSQRYAPACTTPNVASCVTPPGVE